MNRHVLSIHEGIKYQCTICFKSVCSLSSHITYAHESMKSVIKCQICDGNFRSNTDLERHEEAVHGGKKTFKCRICQYSCTTNKNLDNHFRAIHKKEKPFECLICNNKFAIRTSLVLHMSSVHEGRKYTCTKCGAFFTQQPNLKKHIES